MTPLSRRSFLFMTGGSGLSLMTEPGRQTVNKLIPYVIPPETVRPGKWSHYATTCRECPAGCGLLARHRDGRVTKAEAYAGHPVSRGGLCPRGQSSVQGLYDPDRLRQVMRRDRRDGPFHPSDWTEALAEIAGKLRRGTKTKILSDLQTGTLAGTMAEFAGRAGRLLFYEPFNYDPLRQAHKAVFGIDAVPRYRLEEADFILSLGADFLETWVSPVEQAEYFSRMRAFRNGDVGRFAYAGPRRSMTAVNADRFIPLRPGSEGWFGLALLQTLFDRGELSRPDAVRAQAAALGGKEAMQNVEAYTGVPKEELEKLAVTFAAARSPVVLAGPLGADGPGAYEGAVAAALLNRAAGSLGRIVDFSRPHAVSRTAADEELDAFLEGLGEDDLLIIHQTNIAFTRPGAVEKLRRAGTVVYLATLPDETARLADWVLPLDSPLETWGDYEPYGGIHSLIQPAMRRLYDTRSGGQILMQLSARADGSLSPLPEEAFRQRVRRRWERLAGVEGDTWTDLLRRGYLETSAPGKRPSGDMDEAGELRFERPEQRVSSHPGEAHLWLWPSMMLYDGRLANRGWMQESPEPVAFVAWDSWIDIHHRKAKELGLKEGDVVALTGESGRIEAPVRPTEEIHEEAVAVMLGQGHTAETLKVAAGIGVNPYVLPSKAKRESPFGIVRIEKTGRHEKIVFLLETRKQHHRHLLRWEELSKLHKGRPAEADEITMPLPEGYRKEHDLYRGHDHKNHRWAMVIDLQRCIGCGACGVACYAENNLPVVGRKAVQDGLEMAWLKVVPYRSDEDHHRIGWLPMLCQHCDAAPCEPVCPVFAAVHNEEGLNAQIYNRCVGTRYCSNNCPYKVRRFNWKNTEWRKPLQLQLNPEVTVRSRGVMEKCTFCVQRIRQAEYQAKREGRPVRDGEIRPACLQTCPTGVFTFGDLLDPESEVLRKFKHDPRRYQLLHELNTKTAVVYLERIHVDEQVPRRVSDA